MAVLKLVLTNLFRASYLFLMLPSPSSACKGLTSQDVLSLGVCRSGLLRPGLNAKDNNGSIDHPTFAESMVRHDGSGVGEETGDGFADVSVYNIRPAPGKGLGAFAKQHLKRGTPILIEEPLFSVPVPEMVPGQGFRILDMISNIEAEFDSLSSEQKDEFLGLHEFHFASEETPNKLMTIFRSNAYNTGGNHVGMFPKIARINHSCKPNSGNWWSENSNHRIIYASRDIEKGEEITVSYIPLLKTARDRQARLQQYGFTCDCDACNSLESDKRRVKISDSLDDLEQKQHSPSKKASIQEKRFGKALVLIEMIEEEGLPDYLARAYHLAAVFNKQAGHLQEATKWAMKEWEILQVAELDSEEALKAMNFVGSLKSGN